MQFTDGPIHRVISGWIGLVYAGILWLLGCLLVVSAPAATLALAAAVRRIVEDDTNPSLRRFLRDMADDLPMATGVGVVMATGWLFIVLTAVSPLPPGIWGIAFPFVAVPVTLMWAMTTVWVFTILDERRAGVVDAFRSAYVRAARRPVHAFAALSSVGLIVAMAMLAPPTLGLLLWLTVVGASALAIKVLADLAHPERGRSVPHVRAARETVRT